MSISRSHYSNHRRPSKNAQNGRSSPESTESSSALADRKRWETTRQLGGAPAGVAGAEMSAWAGMTIEEYDEQLFAEVEAEIGAAPDSDEELAALEAELAALDDDMQLGAAQDAGHEVTFDGAEATRETRWVRKDGQFQQLGLQEAIEQELENEIEEERRVEAQREDSEDEEIRALRGEVAALEREVAAQANEADQEVLAKIKAGLATIQAYEKAARTNGTQAERAAEEIVNGAAREASRILAEEHAAAVASVSESSGPASELAAELDNSNRPVLDDNIAPWMREMQQCVSFRASDVSHRATSVQFMEADVWSAGAWLQARAINSCGAQQQGKHAEQGSGVTCQPWTSEFDEEDAASGQACTTAGAGARTFGSRVEASAQRRSAREGHSLQQPDRRGQRRQIV